MYRYWTGSAWTGAITPNPASTPPPVPGPGTPGGYPATGFAGSASTGTGYPGEPARRRGGWGWWLAGIAALVAVGVVGALILRGLGAPIPLPLDPLPGPTSTASPDICPPASDSTALPTTDAEPGWISGGNLAFPSLGAPWVTGVDNRVPWGSLASVQEVVDQADYDGEGHSWVASILVSDLFVGDGFASTKVAAETVLKCVLGTYYADTVVEQELISSGRYDVDGNRGWLVETQLNFSIPDLNATGERVLLLVVQTGDADYGLFYASIPDTRSYLLADARTALAGLRVP